MRDDNQNKPKLVDREEGGVGVRQDSGRKRAQEKLHTAMISSAGFSSAGNPPIFLDPFFPMSRAPKSILDHGCTLCALPQSQTPRDISGHSIHSPFLYLWICPPLEQSLDALCVLLTRPWLARTSPVLRVKD
jgi:hypothetical protein